MRQTRILHSIPSVMNSVLIQPSYGARSLTGETQRDRDKTKGNGHINYTHFEVGAITRGLRRDWRRDGETHREIEKIMLTEYPECLLREGMFVLSSKTPAGC